MKSSKKVFFSTLLTVVLACMTLLCFAGISASAEEPSADPEESAAYKDTDFSKPYDETIEYDGSQPPVVTIGADEAGTGDEGSVNSPAAESSVVSENLPAKESLPDPDNGTVMTGDQGPVLAIIIFSASGVILVVAIVITIVVNKKRSANDDDDEDEDE